MVFKKFSVDDPIVKKIGLPPALKDKGETFFITQGSLQYFKGDVERIQQELKRRGIKYRTTLLENPRGIGAWVIYVNNRGIDLDNLI